MPRKRTTASQNHSGSSIERAHERRRSRRSRSAGHEARDVAVAQQRRRRAARRRRSDHRRESTRARASPIACAAWLSRRRRGRRRPAGVDRSRDDRARRRADTSSSRSRASSPTPSSSCVDDGIDLVVHADADDARAHGRLRAQDAHEVGPAARDRGVDGRRSPTPAGAGARRTSQRTCPAPGDRAAVRQQHRRRPPLPRPLHARARRVPALPQHRRVVAQGAVPALVSRRSTASGRARPSTTARSTTSASRSRSCASTASTCSSRPNRVKRTSRVACSEELAEGAEEGDDRVLAGAVAHEADAPALARRARRGRRRPRCRSGRSSSPRTLASSTPSGSHTDRELREPAAPRRTGGSRARAARPGAARRRAGARARDASSPSSSSTPRPACSA